MTAGRFRWGRRAHLVAGACVAISLREAKKPESVCAIARALDEAPSEVYGTIMTVTSLLGLSVSLVTSSTYVPEIQSHIMSVLQSEQQDWGLPPAVISVLRPLSFHAVANTTYTLLETLVRISPDVVSTSVIPTACAAFILATEAETRSTLDQLERFAQILCSPYNVSKSTVMLRYKVLQDCIASWIERVPWLEQYRPKNGRAKVSKRLVVIRGLKDVMQFHAEILKDTLRPAFSLDLGGDNDGVDDDQFDSTSALITSDDELGSAPPFRPLNNDTHGEGDQPARKRRKINQGYKDATHFLLDPLSAPLPSSRGSSANATRNTTSDKQAPTELPLISYILAQEPGQYHPPTRLQRLLLVRGSDGSIADEELFTPGELEGLLRNDQEIEQLKTILGWTDDADTTEQEHEPCSEIEEPPPPSKVKTGRPSKRINMEAYAKLMASRNICEELAIDKTHNDSGADGDEIGDVDEDQDHSTGHWGPSFDTGAEARDVADAFQKWRASRYGQYDSDDDDRYDQEYD
ncbi:hypothetical protein AX16_004193 [Volvariella volvacea WC 439]|nr:hypothetical protein AX16_004193 [Volvariella volvacea WC 439]